MFARRARSTLATQNWWKMEKVEVTVLKVYKLYTYTIPSFCAISLKLRHVQVMSESVNDGDPGVVYDVFFSEEEQTLSASSFPKQARITNGCTINVSVST